MKVGRLEALVAYLIKAYKFNIVIDTNVVDINLIPRVLCWHNNKKNKINGRITSNDTLLTSLQQGYNLNLYEDDNEKDK